MNSKTGFFVRDPVIRRRNREAAGVRQHDNPSVPFRPLCAATTSAGKPCRKKSLADGAHCYAHTPEKREALLARLEKAREHPDAMNNRRRK